jgi:hypothetical protein
MSQDALLNNEVIVTIEHKKINKKLRIAISDEYDVNVINNLKNENFTAIFNTAAALAANYKHMPLAQLIEEEGEG